MAESRTKPEPRPFTAPQRVQAVLAIWTERRRRGEICQELAITPKTLSHWEQFDPQQYFRKADRREVGVVLYGICEPAQDQRLRDWTHHLRDNIGIENDH